MSVVLDEETIVVVNLDTAPMCECVNATCEAPAAARFIVYCACRKMRLGCDHHIAVTAEWFDTHRTVCKTCGAASPRYQVVPL